MATTLIELVMLATLSALLCVTALVLGHVVTPAIFAALASTIAVLTVRLWTTW